MHKLTVDDSHHTETLQQFLSEALGVSRKKAKGLLDKRSVFVNGKRVWMAQHRLNAGDRVEVQTAAAAEGLVKESVLLDAGRYIVVDKPAGMLTNEGGASLEAAARRLLAAPKLLAVHRLDRDTSGCLIVARDAEAKEQFEELFRKRAVRKWYAALVIGRVPDDLTQITAPIDGERAVTRATLSAASNQASLLEVEIETGRMHQIRKHLAAAGHPVLGDKVYQLERVDSARLRRVPRQMLHARRIEFQDPWTRKNVRVEAPLPTDFTEWCKELGLS
jgi:RluA family pseudouridine synthase